MEEDPCSLEYEEFLRECEAQREQRRQARKQEQQEFYQEIGNWLKKHRMQKGLSQNSLSRKLGYCGNKLYLIESGRSVCDLLTFMEICKGIGVHFDVNGAFRLEADEIELLRAYRRKDWRQILQWLVDEL